VQHALRAFTPRDQKAVAAAAQTFRPNPKLDTAKVIMELGKGEALVSFLEGNGTPAMVERVMIRPPTGRIGPITPEERKAIMDKSPVKGKYDTTIDSESAYEMLQKRISKTAATDDGKSPGKSVIVVGAGIAGLATGCYAQMNDYSTRIVEMHDKPGGLCTSWQRRGYTIDLCIHWLVGSKPGTGFHRLWQEIGLLPAPNDRRPR
jgi:hypothetical protein